MDKTGTHSTSVKELLPYRFFGPMFHFVIFLKKIYHFDQLILAAWSAKVDFSARSNISCTQIDHSFYMNDKHCSTNRFLSVAKHRRAMPKSRVWRVQKSTSLTCIIGLHSLLGLFSFAPRVHAYFILVFSFFLMFFFNFSFLVLLLASNMQWEKMNWTSQMAFLMDTYWTGKFARLNNNHVTVIVVALRFRTSAIFGFLTVVYYYTKSEMNLEDVFRLKVSGIFSGGSRWVDKTN